LRILCLSRDLSSAARMVRVEALPLQPFNDLTNHERRFVQESTIHWISQARSAMLRTRAFVRHLKIPNVAIVRITDEDATWDLFVAWQHGKTVPPVRVLIDALGRKSHTAS
jgi:hypothetical protein